MPARRGLGFGKWSTVQPFYVKSALYGGVAICLSTFVAVLLGEFLLWVVGFPVKELAQVVHPANYSEMRRNIEFEYEFKTNRLGLKYPDFPVRKLLNEKRIFIVGDSFVEGYAVPYEQTASYFLEEKLKADGTNARVINGGLSGAGPLQYARIFYHLGRHLQPDLLLVALTYNDVSDAPTSVVRETVENLDGGVNQGSTSVVFPRVTFLVSSFWKGSASYKTNVARTTPYNFIDIVVQEAKQRRYSEERISKWTNGISQSLLDAVQEGRFNGYLLTTGLFNPNYLINSLDIPDETSRERLGAMITLLELMKENAENAGSRFAVTFIPSFYQYYEYAHESGNAWKTSGMAVRKEWLLGVTEMQREVEHWCKEHKTPYLDLSERFRKESTIRSDLNYPLDAHWTGTGNSVAANEIFDWLVREDLLR